MTKTTGDVIARLGNKAFIDTVAKMDAFFAELGWLKGEPRVKAFVSAK